MIEIGIIAVVLLLFIKFNSAITGLADAASKWMKTVTKGAKENLEIKVLDDQIENSKQLAKRVRKIQKEERIYTSKDVKRMMKDKQTVKQPTETE